ncbi:preprotein translocase subunit SecA [Candidatus Roizmanbacteria bacterium CG10_big_fil_rev_8_21_14_0_10_39_12]|uniref:Protein translocase subunit SecA n=1 Tax=Candidatus Roizmanbacteria bacterium CG10_big_fil_rev_8_21_14_0_10_39_12 TaxID=1974852 RepID=A0A2M8KQF6_9BACT|nr:MAG: preprotein translocase subunit SecA [Candidatus Roizmanbacteria bacterium CG10_big_fil_rev_8_21_14_0_10_39_12]
MLSFIKNIFDYNQKELNRIQKIVDQINELEPKVQKLKDADFPIETKKLQKQVASGTSLDEILPWSFALVREAANRALEQRHFDVQMIAAIAMHEGKVVEQKTGEGKTLTATAALYLNALGGKGAHLVTVNDYLARRDAGWMGQIFDFLDLSTSAMISGQSFIYDRNFTDPDSRDPRLVHLKNATRKQAYDADVTYGINSEFGFDYLRDNMTQSPSQVVQRGFNFAIVDEADSVLIDEARTPHIISAPVEQDTSKYYDYAKVVKQMNAETDYVIDEKLRTAHLTEDGILKIEKILGVENIYEKDFDSIFHIEAALKANTLFQIDKDYIVRGDEVIIVDEFTGRLLEGRRFSEGLHQAIEAKEKVAIKRESKTLATVSLQNYFRMYDKLAGMTGTAATEAQEFSKIYETEVLVIPTHRDNARQDHADMIYKTLEGKQKAIVEDIAGQYKKGRPVLVGTTSIDKNELLSRLLNQRGIPHELLNAKNHEQEAQIIEQAGKKHGVTVATNMAGRGVDIVLGGDIPTDQVSKHDQEKVKKHWQKEHDEVVKLGGLYVIGTERHESRRIDNQLRGRSGRQGDAGETRFYVSLEDDVMRIFGGDQISNLMTMLKFPEDQPLSHVMVSKAIEQAQVKVEGFNFDIRENLVEYDDVLNRQRDIVYSLRRKILLLPEKNSETFKETIFKIIEEQIVGMSAGFFALNEKDETFIEQFEKDIQLLIEVDKEEIRKKIHESQQEFEEYLLDSAEKQYDVKEKRVGAEVWNQVVRSMFLSTMDQYWTQHLTAIDDLRQGINLRGYAQMDPLVEYKNEAFSMFEKLLSDINYESVRRVMRVQIEEKAPLTEVVDGQTTEKPHFHFQAASGVDPYAGKQQLPQPQQQSQIHTGQTPTIKDNKVSTGPIKKPGRNDACWCGSGKKYKKCHYPD